MTEGVNSMNYDIVRTLIDVTMYPQYNNNIIFFFFKRNQTGGGREMPTSGI
jgi:hypothetical protein